MIDSIIDWLLELLMQIDSIVTAAGTRVGRLIKWTLALALLWPLAIILCGMLPHDTARIVVPLVTLAPLIGFIAAIFAMRPLNVALGTAAVLTPLGRKLVKKLGVIISIEFALGIYFASVPVSNKLEHAPLLVLILISLLFFRGKMRKAAVAILVLLTIGFFATDGLANVSLMGTKLAPPQGYVKAFCPTRTLFDYRNQNPKSITITLQEGCYHGDYLLPESWDRYFVQKSSAPGDYASVWCNGSDEPGEIRGYNKDMGRTMDPCRDRDEIVPHFSIEGKGTITLTRTREHKTLGPFSR